MDVSDGIAGLALAVSLAAFALPLLRGRQAQLLVTWETNADGLTSERLVVTNIGQAVANQIEVRLWSSNDVNLTPTFVPGGASALKFEALAPQHRVATKLLNRRDGQEDADLVGASWSDGRRLRQHLSTVIAAEPV